MAHSAKRQRLGPETNTNNVLSGSNNIVNARPLLRVIEANKANKSPLFPQYEFHSPQYQVVHKGELAFKLMRPNVSKIPFPGADLQGGYSDTMDSVGYFPALNGLGNMSETLANETISDAQRRYRHKISVIGPSFTTIQSELNLFNQGNTIVTGKGKMSIPNTGTEEIKDGDFVCWDICTEEDYNNSGLVILPFEKDRRSLLVRPARTGITTMDSIYAAIMSDQHWDAHTEERKAQFHFMKGMMAIASSIAPVVAKEYKIGSSTDMFHDFMRGSVILSLDDSDLTTNEKEFVNIYGKIDPTTKPNLFTDIVKASPPEDAKAPPTFYGKKLHTFKKITDQRIGANPPEPEDYIDKFITKFEHTALSVTPGSTAKDKTISADYHFYSFLKKNATTATGASVLKNILAQGVYDLVMGLVSITQSEEKRMLGQAVTPASKGRDFDLILHN